MGGEGGTGKSWVIEVVIAVFAGKGILYCLLVIVTSSTTAARINGITIYAACNVSVVASHTASSSGLACGQGPSLSTSFRVDGQS
jgi:hypothetical protein